METDLKLLGVTGVEDLLQDNVKPVILNLREANIKVWMLTGDKMETAQCIATSTGFKRINQTFYELSTINPHEIKRMLLDYSPKNKVLLVQGKTLAVIFSDKFLLSLFFEAAMNTTSVVLCRCAPKQKAEITRVFKHKYKKIVCSIGDGGNDVGMI